ncbi:DUF2156 domain-containing protein [Microbacterium sp. KR10-403]|uniref:DUF2156 domain-containing protein n=1 Tax=Microbacterium sp. KR10-403 TaxID=3158581 RepID=UPI0032E406E4
MSTPVASTETRATRPDTSIRATAPLLRGAARMPFTLALLAVVIAGGVVTAVAGGHHSTLLAHIALGPSALAHGLWWTPVTSALFTRDGADLIVSLVLTGILVGAAEHAMGTARTVLAYLVTAFVGAAAGAGLQMLAGWGDGEWMLRVARLGSLDPTRPALGVAVAASAFMGVLWRRRVRVIVLLVTAMFILYAGDPSGLYRLMTVATGFALGRMLRPHTPALSWVRSSHHEIRVLAASAVAISALGPWAATFAPGRYGLLSPMAALGDGEFVPSVRGARCDVWISGAGCTRALAVHSATGAHLLTLVLPIIVLLLIAWQMLRGRRAALWAAVVANVALAAWAAVFYGLLPSPAFPATSPRLSLHYWRTTTSLIASIAVPLLLALVLIALRRHFAVGARRARALPDLASLPEARALPEVRARELTTLGGGPLAHIATWPGNRYWFDEGGRTGIAYRVIAQIALTAGGPFGVDDPGTLPRFARFCDDNGWTPVFYSAEARLEPAFAAIGWRTITVAEEAVIDLADWSLAGNRNKDVRTAVNRARRAGLRAVWTDYRSLGLKERSQLAEISESWVAGKNLPEMSFTLGGLDELDDPDVKLMLAVAEDERIEAATSWMPHRHDGHLIGWTLDFMRRRPDATPGVMEFLIASAAAQARADGARELSLSGLPLAHSQQTPVPSALQSALDAIGRMLEPHYGFASLMRFKGKFHPHLRRLVMAYPDPAVLGAVGVALTRAYLPTLSARQIMQLLRAPASAVAR